MAADGTRGTGGSTIEADRTTERSQDAWVSMLPAAAVLFDEKGCVVGASDDLRRLLGEDPVGSTLGAGMSPAEASRLIECVRGVIGDGVERSLRVGCRTARGKPVDLAFRLRASCGGTRVIALAHPPFARAAADSVDASLASEGAPSRAEAATNPAPESGAESGAGVRTGDRSANANLRHELEMLRGALDEHAIVAITDPTGRILAANDRFCRISGYERAELIGRDHRLLNSGFHPRSFFRDLWSTISRGEVFRAEIRNRAKDGSHYWVDTTIVPFRATDGRIRRYVAIRTDITEKKRMNERLMQSSKFAALGELAANLAHEVNNPIGIISGKARLLLGRHRDGLSERAASELEKMTAQCDRLAELTKRLLDYCRPNPSARMRIDLHMPLRRALDFIAHRATTRGVEIHEHLREGRADVSANGNELEQVFLNLLLNALDAMPKGGRIDVRTELRSVDGERRWVADVEDTGGGIDEAIRHRIFDPFFTTKGTSGGTGLGLAISYGIIESHGGTVEPESGDEGGTRFRIILPAWRSRGGPRSNPNPNPNPKANPSPNSSPDPNSDSDADGSSR